MDRSKRIRKDHPRTEPRENALRAGAARTASTAALLLSLTSLALLAAAALGSAAPDPALTDLWDAPVSLSRMCDGNTTLLLICDPGVATCRESVVYFDNKAGMIRAGNVRPAVALLGDAAGIRETVLDLDIDVPVFIDRGESVYGSILDERILPALVLLDKDGRVLETIYGGGESLDGNIRTLIEMETGTGAGTGEEDGFNWWLIVVPVVAALAILPFVLD